MQAFPIRSILISYLCGRQIYFGCLEKGKNSGPFGMFDNYDRNEDEVITVDEIISIAHERKIITMLESDVREMFKKLETDVMDDGKITKEEFENLDTIGLEEYLAILHRENPRFKERHSEQAWLFMEQWLDPTVHNIRERLIKITGLPRRVIYGGEMLQVVHYTPYGHYHAHHDSETHTKPHIPCCHQYDGDVLESVGECRLCRYLTFIMYLNDIEEGGETAFPIADNATYHENKLRHHGNASADKYNLSHGCKRASLIVKPKKGNAILWYNHHLNETNGWMGELDLFSLHGGCDVIKGEKWLSNMWIPAPFETAKEKDSIYLNIRDYELAERQASMDF